MSWLSCLYLSQLRVRQGGVTVLNCFENLNHFNADGEAVMVDVSEKFDTKRTACASGSISMSRSCLDLVKQGNVKKGDVLGVARVAGIMALKKTSELIPLCHILNLTHAGISFEILDETCEIKALCTVSTTGKTGVEMEALTGVSVALLTIYDMCKAADKTMTIGSVCLLHKTGGKSGEFNRPTGTNH